MSALRRTFSFMRPYKWIVVIGFFTVVLPVIMELTVPRLLQFVIDQGIEQGDMQTIWRGSLAMVAAALVGVIATLGQGLCRAQLSQGMAYDMRNALFRHIQSFGFANLDQLQTGQLMTRVSSDVDVVRMFSSNGLSLLLRALLMILGSLVMMFLLDVRLSLIMVALLPLAGLLIWTVMRLAQPMFVIVQRKLSALNTIVQENLAGARVVKAYARERFEIARFSGYNDEYMDEHIKVGRLMAIAMPILMILTNAGIVAVIYWGGSDVIKGRLSIGELVAFNSYLMIAMAPLLLLGNVLSMMSRAEASAGRVWEVLDTEPSIVDQPDAQHAGPMRGRVLFDNVRFYYGAPGNAPGNGASATQEVMPAGVGRTGNEGPGQKRRRRNAGGARTRGVNAEPRGRAAQRQLCSGARPTRCVARRHRCRQEHPGQSLAPLL